MKEDILKNVGNQTVSMDGYFNQFLRISSFLFKRRKSYLERDEGE